MHQDGRPKRRLVVAAGLGLGLGGCGIRLEEDAPGVPLVPTREPIPGEADLIALLLDTRDLAARLRAATIEPGDKLASWHERQAVVLDAALRRAGAPATALDPPAGAGGSASSAPAPPASADSAPASAVRLVPAERAAITAAGRLLEVADPDLLTMLAALRASRFVVCRVLDPDATPPSDPQPSDPQPSDPGAASREPEPELVVPFLAATREAIYGLEVVAARANGTRRTRAIDWLAAVRGIALDQERAAGASAPPAPSAYELPLRPDEEDSAHRLAQYLLGALPAAYADAVAAAAGRERPDRALVAAGSDWLARAAALAQESGTDPGAFPGLG